MRNSGLKSLLKKYKSVVESFLSLSVWNGVVFLVPLIAMPYILRVVGPANYGLYGFIYVLVQYVLIVNNYGFDFSATKEVAQNRRDTEHINRLYNAVLGCRLLLFVATSLFFFALSPWLLPTPTQKFMFLGGLSLVLGNTFTAIWLFQGMEKMRYLTLVNVLGKTLFLILVFVVIRKPGDYVYLPLLDGIGYVAAAIASLIIARRQFGMKLRIPSWADMKARFVSGAAIFGSTLGMTLYRKSNIFILRFFVGDAALGLYTAAEKVIIGIQDMLAPVSQALFPYLGHNFAQNPLKENLKNLKKVTVYMGAFLLLGLVVLFFCSDFVIRILCGKEFMEASGLLRIMSPVLFFGGLNYILGIVGLVNLNRSRQFLYSVLFTGVLSVCWVLCTASTLGVVAGAWAMCLSEIILFGCCLFHLRRLQ